MLDTLWQEGCCKVRLPDVGRRVDAEAILINTSGGLTDGDELTFDGTWQPQTFAQVTTQAAERIYRSRREVASVYNRLVIEDGARACWLPQETIVFQDGRLSRRMDIEMAGESRLFAAEMLVLGRKAMGETVRSGELHDQWRIRLDGDLIFADGFKLEDVRHGDLTSHLAKPAVAGGLRCLATLVYVGNGCDNVLPVIRDAICVPGSVAGASNLGRLVIARVLSASSTVLRRVVVRAFDAVQTADVEFSQDPFTLPRAWHC